MTYLSQYVLTHSLTHLVTYLLIYLFTYLLSYLLHEAEFFLRSLSVLSQEIPLILYKPKVHYKFIQQPATCPYPETNQSSLSLHILLPQDPTSYFPAIYAWFFQVVSLP